MTRMRDDDGAVRVRQAIGSNIRRIRTLRGMKGQDLVKRLDELGFSLPISGLSEVETAKRRVSAEELLVFAVALNASVIDLLTPVGDAPLVVADKGAAPLEPWALERWLRGEIPLPQEVWWESPAEGSLRATAPLDEFLAATSERRRTMHRRDARPEIVAIDELKEWVRRAIEATEDPAAAEAVAENDLPPSGMAALLRDHLERVVESVNLLAKHIERTGYASR